MPTFAALCTEIIKNFLDFNGMETFTSSCVYISVWVYKIVSMFRSNFYKNIKDSHCDFEGDSNQNNHLSRRHIADESDYKWSRKNQGYINFSTVESRLYYKSVEICSDALAKDRVSRMQLDSNTQPLSS